MRYRQALLKEDFDDPEVFQQKISDYKDERLKYHLKEMKDILDKYIELEKIKESKIDKN